MLNLDERFIIDDKGNRISIILDISDYQKLIADLEELESIRAFASLKNTKIHRIKRNYYERN
jgi:hypothetical protein